jgi:hypothetical protein
VTSFYLFSRMRDAEIRTVKNLFTENFEHRIQISHAKRKIERLLGWHVKRDTSLTCGGKL